MAGEVNPPWWRQRWTAHVAENALLVAAGLLLLAGGALPLLRRVHGSLAAGAQPSAASTDPAIDAAGGAQGGRTEPAIGAPAAARAPFAIDPDSIRTLAANDPQRTAQVIKEWIAHDRNGLRSAG